MTKGLRGERADRSFSHGVKSQVRGHLAILRVDLCQAAAAGCVKVTQSLPDAQTFWSVAKSRLKQCGSSFWSIVLHSPHWYVALNT